MLVDVARHLMAPFMPDVLLFERLVSDRGVAAERTTEADVERHLVVDLVGERVDLVELYTSCVSNCDALSASQDAQVGAGQSCSPGRQPGGRWRGAT